MDSKNDLVLMNETMHDQHYPTKRKYIPPAIIILEMETIETGRSGMAESTVGVMS